MTTTTPRDWKEQTKTSINPFDEMHKEQTKLTPRDWKEQTNTFELNNLIPCHKRVCGLDFVCGMPLKNGKGRLVISRGSVVDFSPSNQAKSAIVNAANESCLGGGGVDGAISSAGGPKLARDRRNLPIEKNYGVGVRCPTGQAIMTGPNKYGCLKVKYVIHAVGPNYHMYQTSQDAVAYADSMLLSAYTMSLNWAKQAKLEYVAFSLLSAGIFSGRQKKRRLLEIAVRSILNYDPYDELKEIHICAYMDSEAKLLQDIVSAIAEGKENMFC
eukprot:CAMPEP_0116026192 /NCGR_PEP_ID=MMETSP0321-20121206/13656_1 /TAXON_ID=163516 /ORGANISM="Leptocylindrus danicus var. danicus, Strain B650" /LENGTH=270 /DNA_ID=CAMNT_0003498847 /DNA_START=114 /DNA_END=926 /DNA_ORIENTATION=-